jgi:AcrR family transcriptional regulator
MPARRTARAAPPARQLSEQDIVEAALRLCRKVGADRLSMRSLAAELGVTPMAIYYHVPNKGVLLDLVIDAVLSNVPMPAPSPDRWQAQLKACSLTAWQLLSTYPGLSRVLLTRPNSKTGRVLFGYGIALLLAGGFDEHEAALGVAAFNTYMYGAYASVNALALRDRTAARAQAKRKPGARLTGIPAVVRHLRELRVDDALDFGIDAMLDGLAARAPAFRAARSR